MEELIRIGACVVGCILGFLIFRRRDIWAGAVGITMGLSVAFAILEKNPWYLLVLFGSAFYMFMRRTRVQ